MLSSMALKATQSLPQAAGQGNRTAGPDEGVHFATLQQRGTNMTKRKTEITVERHRVLVISKREFSVVTWCGACEGRTRMVTVDEAASRGGINSRTIYRRVETGDVHFIETPEGCLLVCLNSLG